MARESKNQPSINKARPAVLLWSCPKVKFTHLTFDCYGTLIDWRKGIEVNLGEPLRRSGLASGVRVFPLYVRLEAEEEGQYKSYKEILYDTAIKVADHLKISIAEKDAEVFAASVPSWPPFGDTVEALKELGRRGYSRVILSNVDRDVLKETILRNNLDVDGYITAQDVQSYKPSLGHWNRFFEMYKVSKERTLHVAQSIYHDIVPGGKLGISTAWINRYSEATPTGINPSYVLGDLRSLFRLLA
jgi:2-haloalkanoic acid dehalogenase type II